MINMVSIHPIESLLAMCQDNSDDGQQPQHQACNTSKGRIKKSGTNPSLTDLLSPLASTAQHEILKEESSSSAGKLSSFSSSATTVRPAKKVVVGPEHNHVRTIIRGWKRPSSSDQLEPSTGAQTDADVRLPFESRKFRVPEYSDGTRLAGSPKSRSAQHTGNRDQPRNSSSTAEQCSNSAKILEPLDEALLLFRSRKVHPIHNNSDDPAPFSQPSHDSFTSSYNHHNKKRNTTKMSSPGSVSSSNSKSPQGRRSRSIAIKNATAYYSYHQPGNATSASQSELLAAEEDSVSNERMYDWATWRMYNRIIDHRRNQQQQKQQQTRLPSSSSRGGGHVSSSGMLHHHPYHSGMMDGSAYPFGGGSMYDEPLQGAADYVYDGEVFELDF